MIHGQGLSSPGPGLAGFPFLTPEFQEQPLAARVESPPEAPERLRKRR